MSKISELEMPSWFTKVRIKSEFALLNINELCKQLSGTCKNIVLKLTNKEI